MTALVLGLGLAASARAQVTLSPGSHARWSQGGRPGGRRRGPPPERRRRHRALSTKAARCSTSSAWEHLRRLDDRGDREGAHGGAVPPADARLRERHRQGPDDLLVAVSAMTPLQGGVPIQARRADRRRHRRQRRDERAAGRRHRHGRDAATLQRRRRRHDAAVAPDADGVILIGGATTRDAFVKGRPLIETAALQDPRQPARRSRAAPNSTAATPTSSTSSKARPRS